MTQSPSELPAQVLMGAKEWVMLIALSVLWGGSFFFNGVAVRELPSLTIVLARVGIAALTLWAVLALMNIRMPRMKGLWPAFFGMGLLGVILMLGAELLAGLGTGLVAQLACLAAALSYAFAGIFGRRFKRMGVPPLMTATGQVTASSLLVLPLVLLVDHPWNLVPPSTHTWAALIAIGVASTALAYVLYFRILAAAGATNLLLVTFLIPISAILLGGLFLAESLATKHFIGMGMIGIGLALIDGRISISWPRK